MFPLNQLEGLHIDYGALKTLIEYLIKLRRMKNEN